MLASTVTSVLVLLVASPAVGDATSHGWSDSTVNVTGSEPMSRQSIAKVRGPASLVLTAVIAVLVVASENVGSEIDQFTV